MKHKEEREREREVEKKNDFIKDNREREWEWEKEPKVTCQFLRQKTASSPVWPDLAKFRPFVNFLGLIQFGQFLTYFGKLMGKVSLY